MTNMLLIICNKILRRGEWSSKWTESLLIPLPKRGNTKKYENNRIISLSGHSRKVFLYIILSRIKPKIKEVPNGAQAAFQERRSTIKQICNLRILTEKYVNHDLDMYHNFFDFKRAFDRVWHKALWPIMWKYNAELLKFYTSMQTAFLW